MATVWIPPLLQDLTHGQKTLAVQGHTVRVVVAALDQQFPGMGERLTDNGRIKPGIAVIVDGEVARLGLGQPLTEASEIHFLPALSGG